MPGETRDAACRALDAALERVCPNAIRDRRKYVARIQDNLLPGISVAQIEQAFSAGAGRELDDKMRAPWSSSALAVNSFGPWQDDPRLLVIAGVSGFVDRLTFEARCPNGVSRIPPHLDVLLFTPMCVLGIESKCVEFLSRKTNVSVSRRYLALADACDARASTRWFAALQHVHEFQFLDAYQLVKHFLGLACTFPGRPLRLVYLYWEPLHADRLLRFRKHREEVAAFRSLVEGDSTCVFQALSYPEHWEELSAIDRPPAWLPSHLDMVRRRYVVEI